MRQPRRQVRTLSLLTALLALLATLVGAGLGGAGTQAAGGQLAAASGRVVRLPFVGNAPQVIPPATVNANLTIRPVPLTEVQRGRSLSVEYRYRNDGSAALTARFSLFYPQRLINFDWLDASGDRYISHNSTRVVVEVRGVAPGETRVGRVNFIVSRNASVGSRIGLSADYECRTGQNCQSNFAEVEVIRNSDEGSGGGTFTMSVSPDRGPPGTAHTFSGSRFRPNETYITWLNTPTGVLPLNITGRADGNGNIRFTYGTGQLTTAGFYSMVARGQQSGVENVGPFIVQINGQPGALTAAQAEALARASVAQPLTAATLAAAPAQSTGDGGITGRVVDGGGAPVAGVPIEVISAAGDLVAVAVSSTSGAFLVAEGLATGQYTVTAKPGLNPALTLLGDVSATASVTAPELTRDVTLTVPAAGGLTGTVTAGGAPIAGVRVSALDGNGDAAGADLTDATGSYTITNLPAASYTLSFDPQATARAGLYSPGQLAGQAVTAGQVGAVAPFALTPSATTGVIAGTVSDATTAAGIGDVLVVITRDDQAAGDTFVSIAETAADGTYSSDALPAGAYNVQFVTLFSEVVTTTRYVGEYYNDAATFAEADPVTVSAGATATADAGLAVGSSVGGTVTGDGAGALADVIVLAIDGAGVPRAFDLTDEAGGYSLAGLSAGSYTLEFIASLSPTSATRAFYDGSLAVAVPAGEAVGGANITLSRGAQIVGTVSAADTGEPLSQVLVVFFEALPGDQYSLAGVGETDANGDYSSPALAPGSYRVYYSTIFSPNTTSHTYQDEFFSNQATLATANAIPVGRSLGPVTRNVDLAPGGKVVGRVTASDSGSGLSGVFVLARTGGAAGPIVGGTITDESGDYTLEGLPAETISLSFETGFAPDPEVRGYADGAATVSVTAGAETAGDIELTPAP